MIIIAVKLIFLYLVLLFIVAAYWHLRAFSYLSMKKGGGDNWSNFNLNKHMRLENQLILYDDEYQRIWKIRNRFAKIFIYSIALIFALGLLLILAVRFYS